MMNRILVATCASLLLSGISAVANAAETSLDVTASEHLQTQLYARGVQIYRCAATGPKATTGSWVFQAPEADLFSDKSMVHLVGKHFDGPHCQSTDGSIVAGTVRATRPSNEPNSIPWLLLTGTPGDQPGIFAHVSSIQRVDTHGGATGPTKCDQGTFGSTLKVPYTATYRFYTK